MTDATRAHLLAAAAHDTTLLAFLETLLSIADGDDYTAWTLAIAEDRLRRRGVIADD
jgi:hypothetical protein